MMRSILHIVLSFFLALVLIGQGLLPCADACAPQDDALCAEAGGTDAAHDDEGAAAVPLCHCIGLCRCAPAIAPMPAADIFPLPAPSRFGVDRFVQLPSVVHPPPDHIPLV